MRRLLVSLAATLFLAPSAHAVDGVLEINQACVSVGCFSGDDPDFPVEIDGSAGRSYRLTSDLVFDAAEIGIEVAANDVSIDLGGFEIISQECVGAEGRWSRVIRCGETRTSDSVSLVVTRGTPAT